MPGVSIDQQTIKRMPQQFDWIPFSDLNLELQSSLYQVVLSEKHRKSDPTYAHQLLIIINSH